MRAHPSPRPQPQTEMASQRKNAAKAGAEATGKEADLPVMSLDDVKGGNTAEKCYLAVDGYVCDVTEYLPDHPGSEEQLLDVAGEAHFCRLPRAPCSRARLHPAAPALPL